MGGGIERAGNEWKVIKISGVTIFSPFLKTLSNWALKKPLPRLRALSVFNLEKSENMYFQWKSQWDVTKWSQCSDLQVKALAQIGKALPGGSRPLGRSTGGSGHSASADWEVEPTKVWTQWWGWTTADALFEACSAVSSCLQHHPPSPAESYQESTLLVYNLLRLLLL